MTTEREVRKKLAEAGWTFEEGTNPSRKPGREKENPHMAAQGAGHPDWYPRKHSARVRHKDEVT